MDKAEEFVKDLCEKNVLGKVAGWCYSVEHQKRGLICFIFLISNSVSIKLSKFVIFSLNFSSFNIFRGPWPRNYIYFENFIRHINLLNVDRVALKSVFF